MLGKKIDAAFKNNHMTPPPKNAETEKSLATRPEKTASQTKDGSSNDTEKDYGVKEVLGTRSQIFVGE